MKKPFNPVISQSTRIISCQECDRLHSENNALRLELLKQMNQSENTINNLNNHIDSLIKGT